MIRLPAELRCPTCRALQGRVVILSDPKLTSVVLVVICQRRRCREKIVFPIGMPPTALSATELQKEISATLTGAQPTV